MRESGRLTDRAHFGRPHFHFGLPLKILMSEKVMARKWCRIHGIGEKNFFGHTTEGETILVSGRAPGMEAAQRGDIIEFEPVPFKPAGNGARFRIDFYAQNPNIIARFFRESIPVTRAGDGTRPSAIDWKARKESAADEFSAALQ